MREKRPSGVLMDTMTNNWPDSCSKLDMVTKCFDILSLCFCGHLYRLYQKYIFWRLKWRIDMIIWFRPQFRFYLTCSWREISLVGFWLDFCRKCFPSLIWLHRSRKVLFNRRWPWLVPILLLVYSCSLVS